MIVLLAIAAQLVLGLLVLAVSLWLVYSGLRKGDSTRGHI